MNDAALYTGVDGETADGMFGNETLPEETKKRLDDQATLLKELTPRIQGMVDVIDEEIKLVMSIDRFVSAATQKEEDTRAELQASALYKKYLETLKTRLILALNETKR